MCVYVCVYMRPNMFVLACVRMSVCVCVSVVPVCLPVCFSFCVCFETNTFMFVFVLKQVAVPDAEVRKISDRTKRQKQKEPRKHLPKTQTLPVRKDNTSESLAAHQGLSPIASSGTTFHSQSQSVKMIFVFQDQSGI